MSFKKITSIILLLMFVSQVCAATTLRKPISEYEILRRIPKERLRALIGAKGPDAQGFVGTNQRAGYWIEAGTQRGSCRVVIYGVVTGDLAVADDAWRGIETTFAHQRADGGFEANDRPNGKSAKPLGAAVETACFFMQELGRAILVIRQSPHEKHFRDRIVALEPKMRRTMDFIAAGYDTIIANSGHAANRIVIAAKAFGLCGLVLGDDQLTATSRKLIAYALTRRDRDGVFIENGGRDSSYNVVSILFGQTLALHLPIPEFEAALPKAVAWQLTRIRENGEVDVTGNTRTGAGKETSIFGDPKTVNYGEVTQALTLYGLVKGDKAALAAADRVFAFWRASSDLPK
ncbi:MAG: hypothetical protein ACKV2V_27855 [Blastocatellia bacterium]